MKDDHQSQHQSSKLETKTETKRKRGFMRRGLSQIAQKKCSPFPKYNTQTQLLSI